MSWIVLLILALLWSAWASGSEMAWISANPLQWERWRYRYPRRWHLANFFLRRPQRLLITLLLSNNLALIAFSAALSATLLPVTSWLSPTGRFWIETLIGTLILLLLGEYLPKILFRHWQTPLMPAVVPFTALLYLLLLPLVESVYGVTRGLFRLLRLQESALQKPLTRESLSSLIRHSEPDFHSFLHKTLALSETPVRDFMIPRREVTAIPIDMPLSEVYRTFIETGLSRLLVYEQTPDHIVGYVYVRSVLQNPPSLHKIVEPVSFVPETMPATRLLEELVREQRSIAVVVDARGGMAGLVTTEDLVEEVFGEIQDEHDKPEWVEKVPEPNAFELDARLELDYLNEKYGLALPTDQAVTLGGLALAHLGYIPAEGTSWEAYGLRWTVLAATPQRLLTLRIERL